MIWLNRCLTNWIQILLKLWIIFIFIHFLNVIILLFGNLLLRLVILKLISHQTWKRLIIISRLHKSLEIISYLISMVIIHIYNIDLINFKFLIFVLIKFNLRFWNHEFLNVPEYNWVGHFVFGCSSLLIIAIHQLVGWWL